MKQPGKLWKITLISLVFYLLFVQLSYADKPKINIRLFFSEKKINAPDYSYDENIKVKIMIENKSREDIMLSKGFSLKKFYRRIKLIGPSGHLILPGYVDKQSENMDSHVPPLGYIRYKGEFVRAAPCEIFKKDTTIVSKTRNLQNIFNISLPGYYSAQVQFSIMRFKSQICDVDKPLWQGLLKSDTKYFFYEGKTKIKIEPESRKWKISWKNRPTNKRVKIEIFYDDKLTIKSINYKSIRLNNHAEPKIIDRGNKSTMLYFNPKDCIKSLYHPTIEQLYPAIISGKFNNGRKFSGGQRIRLVE